MTLHTQEFIHIHLQLWDPLFLAAREAGELLQDPLLRWRRFRSSLRADLTMTFRWRFAEASPAAPG